MESLMNRTEPSPISAFKPPGWLLDAANGKLFAPVRLTLSWMFGGR